MSETTGNEKIGQRDRRDTERDDRSIAGQSELSGAGEERAGAQHAIDSATGRLEEREERQHAVQQHGDTFAVDSDEPTDTSGIEAR
jgi:hypothetical protein